MDSNIDTKRSYTALRTPGSALVEQYEAPRRVKQPAVLRHAAPAGPAVQVQDRWAARVPALRVVEPVPRGDVQVPFAKGLSDLIPGLP